MPYPNEHAARVRDPGDFRDDTIRRKNIDKGVDIVIGKLKPNGTTMETQAYRFNIEYFTATEAKKWLKDHDIKYTSFEAATNSKDMSTATLKIYGDIGETNDPFMPEDFIISSKMVSKFIEDHQDAEEIIIRINSRGGDVQEGWAIHDLLVSSGKKIKTIGEGKIYSIATIVFLAGDEREIMKNADGLIHNPFIPPFTLADQYESEDLIKIAESLKQEEEKILDFYAERTGTSAEKLAEYMKEDTKLSAEDMLSLGFATKIIEPVKAYAYLKLNIMTENDVKTFGQKIDTLTTKVGELFKGFSRLSPTDQTLKDRDGNEFTVVRDSGEPVVGDKASPDGTFVMESGKTIIVSGGVITEIKEPEVEDVESLKKTIGEQARIIADLKSKVEAAEKEKPNLDEALNTVKAKEKEANDLIMELQALKNSWKPEPRGKFSASNKVGNIDLNQVREIVKNHKNE